MTLKINTVADSISKIAVTGLTLKDIDEIPSALEGRDCPVMFLDPDNPVTFNEVTFESFGGSIAKKNATYTLNYLLVYGAVGKGRTNKLESIAGMIGLATDVIEAVVGLDALAGAVEWNAGIGETSVLNWNGKSFDSVQIKISITEFVT